MKEASDKKNLRKWLRSKRSAKVAYIFDAVNTYLNSPSGALFLSSKTEQTDDEGTKKFFYTFLGSPETSVFCHNDLDNATNEMILFFFCKACLSKADLNCVKIGEVKSRYLFQCGKCADYVEALYHLKRKFAEQVLFVKFLESCLDKDPYDPKYNLQITLPHEIEKDITEKLDGTSIDDIHDILDGMTLFFNTAIDKIRGMPRHAAVLLKIATPYWFFLSLNLPRGEFPTEENISRLLKARTPSEGYKKYPAVNKLLKPLCTAFYSCLSVCGNVDLADSVIKKYALDKYIDMELLTRFQDAFLKTSIKFADGNHVELSRALTQRDPGSQRFDQEYDLANLQIEPGDIDRHMQALLDISLGRLHANSGPQIKKYYGYLSLFQIILPSIKCSWDDKLQCKFNQTFNFILFEYTTRLTSIAVYKLGFPIAFCFPKEWKIELLMINGFPDPHSSQLNPFFSINATDIFWERINHIWLNSEEFDLIQKLKRRLLKNLDCFEFKDKLNLVDPLQNYLVDLFRFVPLLTALHDKEFYGV